jgi:hypothetical protein
MSEASILRKRESAESDPIHLDAAALDQLARLRRRLSEVLVEDLAEERE